MVEQQWELVDVVSGDFQAQLLRGLLEAQGIPVQLSQEGAGRAIGLSIGALGEVQILVPTANKASAQQVLQDYYQGKYISEDEAETGDNMDSEADEVN
jgi:hypothetical protein